MYRIAHKTLWPCAGYQSGAISSIGATSLLVNLTVFRFNNGSQVSIQGKAPSTLPRLQSREAYVHDLARRAISAPHLRGSAYSERAVVAFLKFPRSVACLDPLERHETSETHSEHDVLICAQGGAIGMSPQGMAGVGPQLQIVDSPFNETTMTKP